MKLTCLFTTKSYLSEFVCVETAICENLNLMFLCCKKKEGSTSRFVSPYTFPIGCNSICQSYILLSYMQSSNFFNADFFLSY